MNKTRARNWVGRAWMPHWQKLLRGIRVAEIHKYNKVAKVLIPLPAWHDAHYAVHSLDLGNLLFLLGFARIMIQRKPAMTPQESRQEQYEVWVQKSEKKWEMLCSFQDLGVASAIAKNRRNRTRL